MRRSLLAMMVLAACSDPPQSVHPTVAQQPVEPPLAEPPPAEPPPAEPPSVEPSSLTDRDLDAMDEPALEAACFAGSSAACDRLGH